MSARTGVVLVTAGAIMALAVTGRPGFIDLHVAGVILIITGGIGLWPHGATALVRLSRIRLRRLLDQTPPVQGVRVPLDDLLSGDGSCGRIHRELETASLVSAAARGAEPDVWSPWGGHQEPGQGSPEAPGGDRE